MIFDQVFGIGLSTLWRGLGLFLARVTLEQQMQRLEQRAKKKFIKTATLFERFKQFLFKFFSQTLDGKLPDNGWGRLW